MDGETPADGKLELYSEKEWGPICADGFGSAEGKIACKELCGYSAFWIFNYSILLEFY